MKRGSPPKRTALKRTRRRINPRSARKQERDDEWTIARLQRLAEARGMCEAFTPACPPAPHDASVVHHRLMRSQGGGHDLANLLATCNAGHAHIHANPAWSYEQGLLIRSSA